MNDNFSFDGADAADMPLDLSFSSLSLPEGEAAAGFHLPEMTPAQEQAKADSPKLVDEWRQDVQMFDDGGLNGLEERAGLEAGVSLDAEAAEEEGSESFNPQLGDMDSVRRQGAMLMKGVEERKREQARDRQNMVMNLLRAGRNDQEALKRIAERWGEDAVSRLESANEEDRSYMLGMWLEEVLGDGDRDVGFQIYKNTHDLWGKGIVSPEQVWKDFAERGKDIVEREDRQRVERERRISDLNGVVSRYVSGEQDSLSADERMALFHAGVSVASMEKARRGVRLMEAFEQDSRLYHDDIADDLFGIIGNDDDALMMLCNLLRNRSRSTAHDRLGMGDAEKRADEAYQEVMENSNPWVMAVAGQPIQNAKMASGLFMTGKVAGVKTKRSLERALQNMRSHEDARMKAAALQVSVAKARQMGLSDAEAFELAGVHEQERRELQQKRSRIFSALTTALEGGEDDYFSSDEASSLSKVGYHLGSMTGDTAPWFLPYAGPLIGLNTSMQRRREEGYMLGLDVDEIEKRAFWFGAADAAEEMIGFHGLFRATPLYKGVRKLLRTKKGAGVRAQVSGSPAAQYALQGVAGTVEEGILEPTAGYLMRSAINPLLDDERGKQTWDQYASELSQMTSGEQGLALLAFSFGLSGLNYSQLSRAAREFRLSLKNYEALGGTAQGYLEAREEKTAEGFLNKALANLHDSWMEDPQSSLERASAAAGERLSGERIESLRELDAWRAAEDAGMVPRVEPAEQEGMFRVYAPARSTKAKREDSTATTGQQEESNQPSYTLMDGEQMTAYLQAFVSEQMESDILYTQHLLAGDVTVNQALAQGRFDAAEVITRTVTDEKTGAERVVIAPETLGQMKARADMAMAAIRALEAEGVSYEDAAARMDASLSEHLPLGTLVKTWEEAQERIRTEQARNPEFKVPAMDAPFSNAYVTKVRRGDTFRRVLRYARGNATVEDLMEETMEQAVISWQAEQGLTWGEFGAMLQEAQRAMNELFPEARGEEMQFIHLDAGKPVTGHDAIEAFSKIGRSRWLADAVNHPSLPSWLRKLLNHLVKFLGAFKARVQLGEMVRQAEEQGVFTLPVRQALAVMLDAGNALYRDQQGDLMELSMERARAQAELDAMFGAGVATEARTLEDELAESRKEDEERRKEAEDEARAPENSPEAQEARREREQARVEALGEPDGSGVFNGAFIEVQEGVRLGFIDKNKLTLCPDVPQFKQGADEQTGVVNPIVGAWQRNAAPISVWRREDGSLQVISGRHRFNACTDEDINCTVYDEAAGFDLDWAQTHDVENNIRDGQASLFEIARYVSQKGLTKEEAVERGIFRKGQSRRGVELGMYGCSDLLDALGNELVSPDDAWRVAMAFRNQTEVQRAGLRALMEGKSWQQAFAVMQVAANMDRIRGLAEAAGMTFETDLFGNSHAEEYFARLAQYAAARVSELTREISSISGASRRPETAKKYGVDVKDAAALEAVVKDLKAQRARWQNFGLHEDLIKEANDAVMVELGVKTREEVDRENGVLPLEAPEQEAVSADTGMLQLSQDVSRMLDAALARGAAPAEDEAPTANFSIIGEKAESFQEYHNNGLSYTDPADGKRKAIIDSRGVRLRKEHVSVSEGGHVNVSLAAALDFPELFRAYPELRRLRVDFYRDSRSGTGGFTDPQEHYIAVNVARGGKNAAPGMVLDTILHEVQHVIQGYEGFAQGAGSMSREQALAYLGESMSQLAGRDDSWAKEALPRLERMRQELENGTLQPAFVYVFSHGEQEARLAGSFEKNSEGVVMSGLNGFRLLDAPPFSIPLTGDITELGGITFGGGRFGRMAGRVLAPNGDWLYDEMVFRMRAAAQRSVSKLRLFETGDRERGLELLAEAQELISTVERYLPGSYGFGLEPYKIWLNVFSLLYGNSGKMAPDEALSSALSAIPMKRWPEIMAGSVMKHFWGYVKQHETLGPVWEGKMKDFEEEAKFAEAGEKAAELDKRRWEFFIANGAEFLEKYGQVKVYRLISKFMARVVEQIDRFRKDRTLGRIRRVAASVAPRTNPQGKPLRGKMDAESYRRLEDRLRLMEMTPAQYDAFFRKNFPEVLDEEAAGQQEGRTLWEDVKPQDMVTVETTDAEGGALALTVTKATFEAYACYEKMSVETAENAARALGEFIATRREAWENAAESKKNEIEDLLRPVLEAAGRTDDQAMATHRKQARLKTLPSGPMSLTGYLLNFSQYMQGLQSVPAFRGIAKKFERRAARFAVQKQACEKDTLAFVKKAAGRILQTEDEYEIADWIYEQRGGLDTGLTITEQEPDWQGKAREEYRAGVLNLIRRKVRKRGAARTLAHVAFLMKDMDAELKAEIERIWPDARDEVWSEKDAAVFTEKELDRYGSQEKYVEEHAARARKASKWGKGKSPYQAQSYKLDHISRMEAAYIILLSQQEDYQEMLRLKGFTQEILEGLEQFAGSEVMEFSRALREKLNERGQEVKEVTESRYGAPFPLIENYFRAFFDVGIEAIDQSIMDAASYGDAATGGKFGLIHARKKHHASLDLSIDVLTAYYAAMNEQDVYLYGSEISRDMRALINYRGENGTRGARVLEKVIGRDALNKLLVWCDSFDKGMAGNVRGFLEMQKSLNRISSAAAITLLPGRVGTWLKQSTALINAAFSSDEIDPHEWAASMARMAAGKLALSPRELMKRAALDARDATETAVIREAMSADEAGRAASGAWKRLNVKGMNLLTQTDVGLNAVSSAILYDAVYRKEMKRNPGLSREEADRRAMMEVELSLSRKAQPMTPQQRSLAAQTRSVWNVGMLFLGGESINTFAETVALWKQGGMKNKAKSVSMFYAHGLLLASMSAMLNFFTDDERRRKRREWWHIFIDALQGPLQGIPFWGALAGGAVRGMSSLCGYRYYEATTSLVPFASWDNLERAGKDLAKLFDGKDKDWVDFPLAFMGALRMAAFGAALGGASTPKGARFKAAAFSAAAFVNLTEFLLRAMKGLPLRLDGK